MPKDRDPYVDVWSLGHLGSGVALGALLPPLWALSLLVLWEPLVMMVVAPVMARRGIRVSSMKLHQPTRRNVLVDLVFDTVGVIVGAFLVGPFLLGT